MSVCLLVTHRQKCKKLDKCVRWATTKRRRTSRPNQSNARDNEITAPSLSVHSVRASTSVPSSNLTNHSQTSSGENKRTSVSKPKADILPEKAVILY
jgi:hypothetical protein